MMVLLNLMFSPEEESQPRISHLSSVELVGVVNEEIAQQPGYEEGQPAIIAAGVNLGALILLQTDHSIIAAPYHRNAGGLQVSIMLGITDKAEEVRALLEKHQINFILLNRWNYSEKSYLASLSVNNHPAWLKALPVEGLPDVNLFQVTGFTDTTVVPGTSFLTR